MSIPIIELNQKQDWQFINSGTWGDVSSAVWTRKQTDDSGQQVTVSTKVAVKSFYHANDLGQRCYQAIYNDFETLFKLNLSHKNVIEILGFKEDIRRALKYQHFDLVMELAEGGSLSQTIHNKDIIYSLDEALNWMCQAADGISYLQSRGIKIGQFRTSNFIMFKSEDSSVTVKINKFGFDYDIYYDCRPMARPEDIEPMWYKAPELFRGSVHGIWRDVYAFGIILWEVFARRKPYEHSYGLFEILDAVVENGARPEPKKLKNVPYQVQELVEKCWQEEHGNRPSIKDVVEELLSIKNMLTEEVKNRIV